MAERPRRRRVLPIALGAAVLGQPSERPYRLVTITGDRWSSDTPVTEVHRIRIAAALRTARELVRAQRCTNDPQLAAREPAAPF
ncbi:hypothetical protein ACFVVA_08330 [Kitasatospora sp. NPDC058048]|uniref:hypothetical protein n=1 Tax=Kitasatospora sp. NPDC058048 TaxID=3346313 RepID=UPI0036DD3A2C